MKHTLLVELFTEELPPKALPRLAASFAGAIVASLIEKKLVAADAQPTIFASPRRLGVSIPAVLAVAADEEAVEKIMPVAVALGADGQPSPALRKKLEARGIALDAVAQFERRLDGKSETFFYRYQAAGAKLADVLAGMVQDALKKLPIPKVMRWGDSDVTFVRPVHKLVMLHGADVVAGEVLGLTAGRETGGHRFLSAGAVTLTDADSYASTLHSVGKVVASFDARRDAIRAGLASRAAALNATLASDDALLDEVTALVEWPVVLEAGFAETFLNVPQECLILTMQQNQKYFPLLDAQGKLMNRFLLVSNLENADPSHIIHGNERVLRARLSDAKFFFEQDQKQKLESRVPRLGNVVYHNQIGTQLERVERLESLAGQIAALIGANVDDARRAARLAKADLVSDMVGEFPELQGIMGMYYAHLDGENDTVAAAIEGHYHPRFAGDSLPVGDVAKAVALADKLETVVGIYGIGLIPTGDKDPFGLRRHALGILRMALELPLDITELLALTAAAFPAGKLSASVASDVFGFMLDRLKNLLLADARADEIDAVLALAPTRLDRLRATLAAVAAFRALPEAATLAAANKRVKNILKKVEGEVSDTLNPALLAEAAEQALAAAIVTVRSEVDSAYAAHDLTGALTRLAALKAPVDAFFDGVMVMADDLAVRQNRLALLAQLAGLFNRVADISLLLE
ncbi:glycine--tRNA ligase subunit beta [Aquaspirillum sp. LM1]|uniref:glycine--tRNA ligase subunit beta n=1 Tax=Aquaspirillum sp. LM1 TaxID=1938604 RepID=UPI000983ADB0|nr:glycine--tRNA ligase subunit beta [Aquaspirillum sp. LM1]AQR65059.1 glycine--tRNA ligase subunit beta [Aquaspirillum sp. LM1]